MQRYLIVGLLMSGKAIKGYRLLRICPDIIESRQEITEIKADSYIQPDTIINNAEIHQNRIDPATLIGNAARYPQYDIRTRKPVITKYNHAYKAVLVGKCNVRKSGMKHEGIVFYRDKLVTLTYEQLIAFDARIKENHGCISNGSIDLNSGRPEAFSWKLTSQQRAKALYVYVRTQPLQDIAKINRQKLSRIRKEYGNAEGQTASQPDTENRLQDAISVKTDDYVIENGVLTKWTGNKQHPVIPEGTKEIAPKVFMNELGLRQVTLPSSLETLGDSCFRGCINLEQVNAPRNNIKTIGSHAFFGTDKLRKYSFSPQTETIGDYSFAVSGLEQIDLIMPALKNKGRGYKAGNDYGEEVRVSFLPEGDVGDKEILTGVNVGVSAFANNYRLSSVEFVSEEPISVGESAFENCEELKSLKGHYYITHIGDCAFKNTPELTQVTMTNLFSPALKSIGEQAFLNCGIKGSVTLPCIETIGANAFGMSEIDGTLTIYTENLDSIGDYAFVGTNIERVVFVSSNKTEHRTVRIGRGCFSSCTELKVFELCSRLHINGGTALCEGCPELYDVVLGELTDIPQEAFSDCASIKTLNLNNVHSIGDMAFSGTGLLNVVTSASRVGKFAFANTPLKSFIGENVTRVDESAFSACSQLDTVVLNKTGVQTERNSFSDTPYYRKAEKIIV